MVGEHLYEILLAIALFMAVLPLLEWIGARRPAAVPGVYFAGFALLVAVQVWLVIVRPSRMGAAICGDQLLIANFWRCHSLRLSDLAEVRCIRGRTNWPLIEFTTADGQSTVVESADFRSLDLIASMLRARASPGLRIEPASDDPLFEFYGYNSVDFTTQTKDFVRSTQDGSWFQRQLRIY